MKRTLTKKRASVPRTAAAIDVLTVTASDFRNRFKARLASVKDNRVLLVQNRRQKEKYVVDKVWLDHLLAERESILATLEILADRKLTERLLTLAKTVDDDVAQGRFYTMADALA
jgi:hypothetical protein